VVDQIGHFQPVPKPLLEVLVLPGHGMARGVATEPGVGLPSPGSRSLRWMNPKADRPSPRYPGVAGVATRRQPGQRGRGHSPESSPAARSAAAADRGSEAVRGVRWGDSVTDWAAWASGAADE
jgi:hypothetical protein